MNSILLALSGDTDLCEIKQSGIKTIHSDEPQATRSDTIIEIDEGFKQADKQSVNKPQTDEMSHDVRKPTIWGSD